MCFKIYTKLDKIAVKFKISSKFSLDLYPTNIFVNKLFPGHLGSMPWAGTI